MVNSHVLLPTELQGHIIVDGCKTSSLTRLGSPELSRRSLIIVLLLITYIIYGLSLFVYHRNGYSFSLSGDSHKFLSHIFIFE